MILRSHPLAGFITVKASISWQELENHVQAQGFTLGFSPTGKIKKGVLLRELLENATPNRWFLQYGEWRDLCVAVAVQSHHVTDRHHHDTIIQTKLTPRAATGPDFKKMFIGSKGYFGPITEATLRLIPLPEKQHSLTLRFSSEGEYREFCLQFWGSSIHPLVWEKTGKTLHLVLSGLEDIVNEEIKTIHRLEKTRKGRSA